ncbi:MAG: hypothetical protein K5753_06570 [Clostridia bacterium]|nr:hypothetical protein [Clostridia bacterium]
MGKAMEKSKTGKKSSKKTLAIVLIVLIVCGILSAFFTNQKASWYTEAEHVERISERIQKRFIDGEDLLIMRYITSNNTVCHDYRATGFEVYPIYDENDRLKFSLVEFQPYGYMYVSIQDEHFKIFRCLHFDSSMYSLSAVQGEPAWSPISSDKDEEGDYLWETDENGIQKFCEQSPFAVRGKKEERKYFIRYETRNGWTYIPAVKSGDSYINLFSENSFELVGGVPNKPQVVSRHIGFINKKHFDL